jgi:cytochrome c-type biogenesis protein CcmH/NrfG
VNDLVAEDPDFGFGLALKARILARRGELAAALELYRRALRLEPRNAEALLEAARVAASLGRTRMARRFAERAREATESPSSRAVVDEFLEQLPSGP